jgi:hypothetical protein
MKVTNFAEKREFKQDGKNKKGKSLFLSNSVVKEWIALC